MSTPPRERSLEGLCLKATPLGEQDRLLLLLTEEEGLLKLAASGARKPRSSLAAAGALTLIKAQVARGRSLDRLRQAQVIPATAALASSSNYWLPANGYWNWPGC